MSHNYILTDLELGSELPSELLQTLLHMAPTPEEELKLKQFSGELSQLGPAERFLKALVDIPFAFKRLESLLFMSSLQEEVSITKESFATLELAYKKLRNSQLFLKLLEAVLKMGNCMNDGTFCGNAQAFKLDTLSKLADIRGTDGKTTLLHFVVLGIIRSEGTFVQNAEIDIKWLKEEEKRIMALVKSTGDYFHRNAGKDEGLRLFAIVRDFLIMLDKACKEVRDSPKKPSRLQKKEAPIVPSSSDPHQPPSPYLRQRLFLAITDRLMDYSSLDDETP
ncbi:hypothetical protein L1049_012841 [Liquidambar formosana]|uniref:Formin-like protein n=1 Tax=Liquidambar formosana TaxID=63359 RepID=A0AAP0RJE4_LIQFO